MEAFKLKFDRIGKSCVTEKTHPLAMCIVIAKKLMLDKFFVNLDNSIDLRLILIRHVRRADPIAIDTSCLLTRSMHRAMSQLFGADHFV